jgi:hypothetical protein
LFYKQLGISVVHISVGIWLATGNLIQTRLHRCYGNRFVALC